MPNAAPRVCRMALAILPLTLSIAGCSSVPRTAVIARCPPLKAYGPQWQAEAARELRALPPSSRVAQGFADYGALRARCRAYEGK